MTFEEWKKENYMKIGGAPLVAEMAWKAATERAAEIVRRHQVKYGGAALAPTMVREELAQEIERVSETN